MGLTRVGKHTGTHEIRSTDSLSLGVRVKTYPSQRS